MNLAEALRLGNTSRLALVGAGGKTSALFAAANALGQRKSQISPIILTTTTHLAIEQCKFANYHFKIQSAEEVRLVANELKSGIVLFTGTDINDGRIIGPDKQALTAIFELAESHTWPLLVEADGARLHPLKAPGEHEPAIPEWANHVVVCAGLSGLDKPLHHPVVHRPEIYTQLSDTEPNDPIKAESMVKVLKHPAGGLKSIPASARRSVLLNQADTPHQQATARRMAEQLLDTYDSVIISHLNPPDGKPAVIARIECTAGIILAAGSASRLGQPKQLLKWRDETFIHRVARTALQAGLDPVYVVSGAYAKQVETALQDLPVHIVFNQNWETGQGASVAAGVQALPSNVGAAVFLLADQPWTPPGLISALIEAHAVEDYPIIGPLFEGKRGNPVLFDCRTFVDLSQLKGEEGGRSIFSRYQVHWLPWHDASAGWDIDTPADLKRLID